MVAVFIAIDDGIQCTGCRDKQQAFVIAAITAVKAGFPDPFGYSRSGLRGRISRRWRRYCQACRAAAFATLVALRGGFFIKAQVNAGQIWKIRDTRIGVCICKNRIAFTGRTNLGVDKGGRVSQTCACGSVSFTNKQANRQSNIAGIRHGDQVGFFSLAICAGANVYRRDSHGFGATGGRDTNVTIATG